MPNEYYTRTASLIEEFAPAKASPIAKELGLVEAGFDMLPSKAHVSAHAIPKPAVTLVGDSDSDNYIYVKEIKVTDPDWEIREGATMLVELGSRQIGFPAGSTEHLTVTAGGVSKPVKALDGSAIRETAPVDWSLLGENYWDVVGHSWLASQAVVEGFASAGDTSNKVTSLRVAADVKQVGSNDTENKYTEIHGIAVGDYVEVVNWVSKTAGQPVVRQMFKVTAIAHVWNAIYTFTVEEYGPGLPVAQGDRARYYASAADGTVISTFSLRKFDGTPRVADFAVLVYSGDEFRTLYTGWR